jgi:hypothetical protein
MPLRPTYMGQVLTFDVPNLLLACHKLTGIVEPISHVQYVETDLVFVVGMVSSSSSCSSPHSTDNFALRV